MFKLCDGFIKPLPDIQGTDKVLGQRKNLIIL